MGRGVILSAVILFLFSCSNGSVEVKQWYDQARLTAETDVQANSGFGQAVAMDGDYAVVGACLQDIGVFTDAGAVLIYLRSGTTWSLYDTLTGAVNNDQFGYAVDISGDNLIIGAAGTDPAAYIYTNNGTEFVLEKKFTAGSNTAYATTVAIDGNWAVVGDKYHDWGNTAAPEGVLYVYYKSTNWVQKQLLYTAAKTADILFGAAVDISDGTIAAGAPHNDKAGTDAGAVYIYTLSSTVWGNGSTNSENYILTNPAGEDGDYFGYSVNISAERLAAAGRGNGGSAVIFTRTLSGWYAAGYLAYTEITATDRFGYTVAVSGSYAVAGAAGSDITATDAGSLYMFKSGYNKWEFDTRHTAADAAANAFLGSAVAMDGDYIISGAPGCTSGSVANAGAAYIYFRDYIQ